ncbi:LPS O-antigen subunit length determinant protein (WzzB/FepE family) [Tamilnaduibacter salinus]|uniref:LPS O-antigen subunit length determinant protein (WzzB/FepE family) n=1 Tax=Tamilnaduibacter salinus TaxID=1484056 RepID=A0A2U1CUT2_9GAMM|nr:Wzz/FepE/Etk N-terminal domain-containing protein [Tamilnaduibacter salinus]PVY70816.1 LPS O-antigen subunit length determinant protein (WzzB/FepE family) [Tamilnaduibacter salinus]
MNERTEQAYYPDDEIDLRDLFRTLWDGKWLIMAITFVFAVGGVAYALWLPDIYKSEALLAPANGEQSRQLGGQLGSLASLAGVNIGEDGSSKVVIAKETLKSRAFLADFIRRHNLEVPLMATEGWNVEKGEWIIDREVYNPETNTWLNDDEGESMKPSDWDLVKRFRQELLSVSQSEDTGMITVSIDSKSPVAAQQWTEWLVEDINEHMREQDVREANKRIDYLRDKLQETNITGMQQVFYQLIESETRTVMLANASDEYVFETVDPAVIPEEESEPSRALICVVITILGGMLAVFVVFIRSFIESNPDQGGSEFAS